MNESAESAKVSVWCLFERDDRWKGLLRGVYTQPLLAYEEANNQNRKTNGAPLYYVVKLSTETLVTDDETSGS